MSYSAGFITKRVSILLVLLVFLVSACNLTTAPEQQLQLTQLPSGTPPTTQTGTVTGGLPTTVPVTAMVVPTRQGNQLPPTSISLPPTFGFFPTSTPTPISIVILSPIPGNVVAGNIQVLGAAIHPQFLQYQLEYGPDPNPGNLWFPATGIVQTPVLNGLLGIWNTTVVQDSTYQLRLRVTLRDGSSLATVVNNIRVQNQAPTPIPSITPNTPRPIAAFTQDRASGLAPLVVKFTNQSSGTITSYSWSFGDGGSSPQASPTYTFRNPGLYTVTLNVSAPGGSSNVSRQINVQSPTTPVAGFTQDKTSGPSPLTVNFTNQSTGTISTYSWVFGDGATSSDQNPSHQFVAVGTYNVILTVTGSGGTSSVTRKITVEDPVIPAPEAIFTPDKTSGDAPLTVQFANQSTGQITNYLWDFGDKETSTDQNPSHIYNAAGTYTVTLTAIGPGGQKTAQTTITVNQPPAAPVAAFTEDKTSGDAPLTVRFTDQSQGNISTYEWNFGDGSATVSDKNPSHTFATAGTYTVKLTVTGAGGSNSVETTINATQPIAPPDAAFTQDVTTGTVPFTVQFTNQSSGENLTFVWNFGDGSPTSSDMNPAHEFTAEGAYTVTLTVSNSSGSDSAQISITANAAPPLPVKPVASFVPTTTAGDAPLTVNFDSSSSIGDITTYNWTFGDGVGASAEPNPVYVFNTPGTYTISLFVSGPGGDSDTVTATITVNQPAAPPPSIAQPVVFVTNRDGNNEIYVLQTDGTLTNLTNSPANDTAPVWSHDGTRIAFVSDRDNGNNDVFVMNADGSNPINITTNTANDGAPVWSPDNSQLAFVTDRDGNNEIYLVNVADPTVLVNISNNPANDNSPAWASQIAFVSDRDNGNNDVFVMNADGSNPVNITTNAANDTNPRWKP